jgi:hypothetical protein
MRGADRRCGTGDCVVGTGTSDSSGGNAWELGEGEAEALDEIAEEENRILIAELVRSSGGQGGGEVSSEGPLFGDEGWGRQEWRGEDGDGGGMADHGGHSPDSDVLHDDSDGGEENRTALEDGARNSGGEAVSSGPSAHGMEVDLRQPSPPPHGDVGGGSVHETAAGRMPYVALFGPAWGGAIAAAAASPTLMHAPPPGPAAAPAAAGALAAGSNAPIAPHGGHGGGTYASALAPRPMEWGGGMPAGAMSAAAAAAATAAALAGPAAERERRVHAAPTPAFTGAAAVARLFGGCSAKRTHRCRPLPDPPAPVPAGERLGADATGGGVGRDGAGWAVGHSAAWALARLL